MKTPLVITKPSNGHFFTGVEKLLNKLHKKEEQEFLLKTFPRLVNVWISDNNVSTKSDWLTLTSTKYQSLDAMMVALYYLKPYYGVDVPRALYRVTSIDELPTTKFVTVGKGSIARKPLLSWTSRKTPIVNWRTYSEHDIILKWTSPIPDYVLAYPRSLETILINIKPYASSSGKEDINDAVYNMRYLNEDEYLVYLYKPIRCTWRETHRS